MHEIALGYAAFREERVVRNELSVMLRCSRTATGDPRIPGAHEKFVHRMLVAVLRTDTGALAEKAKT